VSSKETLSGDHSFIRILPMNRFAIHIVLFIYYAIWLLLPIFDLEGQWKLFPLPSIYAIYIPIVLLLIGFTIVGTFVGLLLLRDVPEDLDTMNQNKLAP